MEFFSAHFVDSEIKPDLTESIFFLFFLQVGTVPLSVVPHASQYLPKNVKCMYLQAHISLSFILLFTMRMMFRFIKSLIPHCLTIDYKTMLTHREQFPKFSFNVFWSQNVF
jgi:hypothetical protein